MRVLRNLRAPDRPSPEPKQRKRKGRRKEENPRVGRHPTKRRVYQPDELPELPQIVSTEQVTTDLIKRDMLDLELIVAQALHGGLGSRTATKLIRKEHGKRWSYEVVWQAINRVQAEWDAEYEEVASKERGRQVERLRQDLARERAKGNPSLQAIRGHEHLLACIVGTLRPIRVEVDVTATLKASIAAVIVDMSEEEKDQIVAEQLEMEAMFKQKMLPPQAAE
jgi:hypothetical protein